MKLITLISSVTFCSFFNVHFVCAQSISGVYSKKGKDFLFVIKLNSVDSTFILSKKYFEVKVMCTGRWKQEGNKVYLYCAQEDIGNLLSSGYLQQRIVSGLVLSSRRIKIDNIVLNRRTI